MTNLEIAELFRRVAAAYEILEENRFKIIAYDRAATSIEHLTSEAKDLWDDGKLDTVPGIGAAISKHLDELFTTGKVRHFDSVMAKVPAAIFPLLQVPGLGPKKSFKLVTTLRLNNPKNVVADLERAAKAHKIAPIEGFGEKSEEDILGNIASYKKGYIKENRMVLSEADAIATLVIDHLKKSPAILRVDTLGSLRRQVSTIGDIDISVATKKPDDAVSWFLRFPHTKVIEKGPTGASLLLVNGRQVDMRVQKPEAYGAMLQYFTGSKDHNIKLREYALSKGMSLNEYGIKDMRTKKMNEFATEEDFYGALSLPCIAPELREDRGEIEAAIRTHQGKPNGLPKFVTLSDIKGDLHIHTNYDLEPSHDLGAHTLEEYLTKAVNNGYSYIGLSDHNPSVSRHAKNQIVAIMKRRKEYYEHHYSSWIKSVQKQKTPRHNLPKIFIMCEVDITTDGSLALPDEAFAYVDAVVASVHSAFSYPKQQMTARVVRALTSNPKVKIFGHPTGRLLGSREGYELEWREIFAVCKKQEIALEINAYPERLDLPDSQVPDAITGEVKLVIDTDAHAVDQMDMMRYGVSVARRGWAEARDIVNTMDYNSFKSWLSKEV